MGEQKHTAWRIAPPVAYAGTEINIDCGESGLDGFICTVGHRGDPQAEENAHLIVRAVNTYPAVEKLIRTLEFYADPAAWKKKNDPENLVAIPDFYFELDFGMEAKEALNRFHSLEAGKGGVG